MQLNIPLQPDDTIFIPDNLNARVFVLGEVKTPGLYDLGGRMTVLEAIEKAGSYTDTASLRYVRIVRGDLTNPKIISIDIQAQINKGIIPKNQNLKPNDIVFVPKGPIAKLNFVLDQISPSLRTIILGDSARNAFSNKQTVTPIQIP
jgi:polysaccharide export outer membrane protein